MGVNWTEEQQKVINLRDRNILVSAAAGSGKTAVLVERIIRMLTDEKNPLDVDQLLVVTFTEAAAAEMKERVRSAIEKELEVRPEDVHLQRQATLIHSAQITTIHSFCLSVIREHFHVIDIDPGFRIGEEGELKLLQQDVLEELFEANYAEGDKAFLELTEKLGNGKTDKKLEELVLQVYEYSRSYPQPEKWLAQCVENYENENTEAVPLVFQQAEQSICKTLQETLELLRQALKICEEPDGPYMYADMLEADIAMLEPLGKIPFPEQEKGGTQAETEKFWEWFSKLYQTLSGLKWKRLSSKKDEMVSVEKRERVKSMRSGAKNLVEELVSSCFFEAPEEILSDMKNAQETMRAFVRLVQQFADAFAEKKRSRNMIDFSDMEQFALKILTVEREGELIPSPVAGEYQNQFREVMIDEYQDSNLIQDTILTSVSTVSIGRNNIFMVGDVKQSIYRFRLSRPELFMEKYHSYSHEDSSRQRIDLHKNFRSRTEVLDSTNYVFERIMRKELGGIEYDGQAALYPGADYEPLLSENGRSVNEAELLLLDSTEPELSQTDQVETDKVKAQTAGTEEKRAVTAGTGEKKKKISTRELEARMIAKRIKELIRSGSVRDKETGENRPVRYGDIVILTRSVKGWAEVFSEVLLEEGIPAYAGSREGYFGTYEVSVLLDYLRLLDNQRQELPLAAVLASPFAGLSAQEMAQIRLQYPDIPFYEAAEKCASEQEKEENGKEENETAVSETLHRKLHIFYDQLTHFREMVPYTAIHELLWKILEETGYALYIAAMPGGEQRQANVEMLVEKASAFEKTSYKGLFNFVRYIEQLQKYDVDYGEANIADEQADTVRIMSIHKSKGLEFPIVFAAGMGKKFNMQDTSGPMVLHPEWGVGIDAVDLERRTKAPTLLKNLIGRQVKMESLGEELRILYVAMTRAKEKLILTGQMKDAAEEVEKNREAAKEQGNALTFYQLSTAGCYLDWLLPAVTGEDAPFRITVWDYEDAAVSDRVEQQTESMAKDTLLHWDTGKSYKPELKKYFEEQFAYRYPYAKDHTVKMNFTVSELKKRAYLAEEGGELLIEEPEVIPLLPRFMQQESELTGASRGTAYHKLMELLDFSKDYDAESLKGMIDSLQSDGKLSEEMASCIRISDVLGFLHSSSGRRMQAAAKKGRLKKEQPFVLGIDAGEIYPEEKNGETLLVQGIIDVYFEEEDGLVVLDYKTDQVHRAEELREKYHAQLEYYAGALEQILGQHVKEKIIYSFTLREEIIL